MQGPRKQHSIENQSTDNSQLYRSFYKIYHMKRPFAWLRFWLMHQKTEGSGRSLYPSFSRKKYKQEQLVMAAFKGIVHPKMKMLSAFTHPKVDPNLLNTLEDILKKVYNQAVLGHHWLVGKIQDYGSQRLPELLCFPQTSEYLPLCSAEQRHSYRFGTTWGWVNDERIFIFGWTVPLSINETWADTQQLVINRPDFTVSVRKLIWALKRMDGGNGHCLCSVRPCFHLATARHSPDWRMKSDHL